MVGTLYRQKPQVGALYYSMDLERWYFVLHQSSGMVKGGVHLTNAALTSIDVAVQVCEVNVIASLLVPFWTPCAFLDTLSPGLVGLTAFGLGGVDCCCCVSPIWCVTLYVTGFSCAVRCVNHPLLTLNSHKYSWTCPICRWVIWWVPNILQNAPNIIEQAPNTHKYW